MKTLFVVLTLSLLSFACGPKLINYHSDAGISFLSKPTESYLTFIKGDHEYATKRKYGVFTARDNVNDFYILISPKSPTPGFLTEKNPYKKTILMHSATLLPQYANELMQIVHSAIDQWDKDVENNNSIYLEYLNIPKNEQAFLEVSGFELPPILRFIFQKNAEGSYSELTIGQSIYSYMFKFKNKGELEDFEDLLNLAFDDLRSKGLTK